MFVVKETISGGMTDEERIIRQKTLYAQCETLFTNIRESIKLEELQETYKNLRFTANPENGRKYPHVTDILYWDAEFYISDTELSQYGARGSAIHAMIENWIVTKQWDEKVINKRDLILLKTGSLRLYDTLDHINFLGFMEKYGKDITFGEGEYLAFNHRHFYCGSPDREGTYQGRPALFDFKTREAKADDFKQIAMYLNLDKPNLFNIKESKGIMVVIPLNPDNKSGFGKPVIEENIEKHFNLALRDRKDFKDKFGI